MQKPLDNRESVFVQEYLIDLDPKRAAIAAGYSGTMAATKAYQWVSNGKTKPHVFKAIAEAMLARSDRTKITQDDVLQELRKIGFSDMRKAVRWGASGEQRNDTKGEPLSSNDVVLVASDELDDDTAAAISEVSQTAQGIKIKLHDKRAALMDIGRHLGMFDDKLRLLGDDKNPVVIEHKSTDYAALRSLLGGKK